MRILFQTPNPNSKKVASKHRTTIFRQALQEEAKEVHTALMMASLGIDVLADLPIGNRKGTEHQTLYWA